MLVSRHLPSPAAQAHRTSTSRITCRSQQRLAGKRSHQASAIQCNSALILKVTYVPAKINNILSCLKIPLLFPSTLASTVHPAIPAPALNKQRRRAPNSAFHVTHWPARSLAACLPRLCLDLMYATLPRLAISLATSTPVLPNSTSSHQARLVAARHHHVERRHAVCFRPPTTTFFIFASLSRQPSP